MELIVEYCNVAPVIADAERRKRESRGNGKNKQFFEIEPWLDLVVLLNLIFLNS